MPALGMRHAVLATLLAGVGWAGDVETNPQAAEGDTTPVASQPTREEQLATIVAAIHADSDSMLEPPPIRSIEELTVVERESVLNDRFAMISSIALTPKGRLWNGWFSGNDGPNAYMAMAKSDDDGQSWSPPKFIVRSTPSSHGIARPIRLGCLWSDPDGRLWVFFAYCMVNYDGRAGVWAAVCDNPDAETPTWTTPRRIWHGTALNKPTILSNGDWLLPVALWQREYMSGALSRPTSFFETGDLCHTDLFRDLDPLRMSHALVSSDQGKTWERRGGFCQPQRCHDEHMFVELNDGRVWALCRTTYGYLAQAFSPDQGRHWGGLGRTSIECPSSRFFVRKLQSGRILLVHHKVQSGFPGGYQMSDYFNSRRHLTAWLSEDEGATWKGGLLLDDERTMVASPDGCQAPDGRIFLTYEMTGRVNGGIFLAIITEDDILAGKPVSKECRLKLVVKRPPLS
jgi:hypothetical protein